MRPVLATYSSKSSHHCQISLRLFFGILHILASVQRFNSMNEMQFLLNFKHAHKKVVAFLFLHHSMFHSEINPYTVDRFGSERVGEDLLSQLLFGLFGWRVHQECKH